MALGRVPTPPVVLPDVTYEADILATWLKETEAPQRRPEATAKILALIVKLHLDGMKPWPTRRQVQAHLGVSLPMIDVVLSQRQASGQLTVWTRTVEGNVVQRLSVITLRFIQPSQELINIVVDAVKERVRVDQAARRHTKRQVG